jgi:hypothetical protein
LWSSKLYFQLIELYPDANHGAGICTYIYPKNFPNVGKYTSTMEHLGMVVTMIYHRKGNHDLSFTTILRETHGFYHRLYMGKIPK